VPNRIIEVNRETVEAFLGNIDGPAPGEIWMQSAFRTVGCAAIADRPLILARLGEHQALRLFREYDVIIRRCIEGNNGTGASRFLGGNILFSFTTAVRAVDCALNIQRAFLEFSQAHPQTPIEVKLGIHAGEPVTEQHGEFYGVASDFAARLCAEATPGTILVSRLVRDICGNKRFVFADAGSVTTDDDEVPFYSVAPQGTGRVFPGPVFTGGPKGAAPDHLTPREIEVLKLIAVGRTNNGIAMDLVISPNTVARHISHIFAKTGVGNRAQAAAYAAVHGLFQSQAALSRSDVLV
jgi:DNA-binding CsgD family transcriptional regulator